jgi:hypothetical protein
MQGFLRKALIDSHVAAIAIADLLLGATAAVAFAAWEPASGDGFVVLTARVMSGRHGIPRAADNPAPYMLWVVAYSLLMALASLSGAWILSHWVYGTGPLRVLSGYKGKFSRKANV